MPLDKGVYVIQPQFSYFSTKPYVVGTQKNHLDETALLSTQNKRLNLADKNLIIHNFLLKKLGLFRPMHMYTQGKEDQKVNNLKFNF